MSTEVLIHGYNSIPQKPFCGKYISQAETVASTKDITKITCPDCTKSMDYGGPTKELSQEEAEQLDKDFLNPSLHSFALVPSMPGVCGRCKQSPIVHGAVSDRSLLMLPDGNMTDAIRPSYYKALPNGIECKDITSFFSFNLGNAIKYIWRAGKKSADSVQDLQKAIRYLEFEVERIKEHGSQS